jgi:PAS domain S-box-containing protein
MNPLSALSLLFGFFSFSVGVVVIRNNHKSLVHVLFFLFAMMVSWWDLSFAFFYVAPTLARATLWYKISMVGVFFSTSIYLSFILVMVTGWKKTGKYIWLLSLHLPPLFLLVSSWAGWMYQGGFIITPLGWTAHSITNPVLLWFFNIYVGSYTITAIIILIVWAVRSRNRYATIQAVLIISATLLPILYFTVAISITDILRLDVFPEMTQIPTVLLILAFWYVIRRHNILGSVPEEVSRSIYENVSDMLIMIDENGDVITINPRGESILNKLGKETDGTTFDKLFSQCGISFTTISEECKGRENSRFFCSLLKNSNDFSYHMVVREVRQINGRLIGYLLVGHDITHSLELVKERKTRHEIEQVLEETEQINKLVVDSMNRFIHVVDRDLRVIMHNRFEYDYIERLGLDPDITGKKYREAYPFLPDTLMDEYAEMFVHGETVVRDYEFEMGPGMVKNFQATWVPIKRDDKVIYMMTVIQDITELKRNAEMAVQAEKLKSVGILAGGLAHDFNNILSGVMGNIDLARYMLKGQDKVLELIDGAFDASQQAKGLAHQLLTFAQGGTPVIKTGNLGMLLDQTVTFVLRGTSLKSRITVPAELWNAEYDADQLGSVFHNVTLNALQASSEGETITVTAENFVSDGSVMGLQVGEFIKVTFEDHGPGMKEEQIRSAFDPYFTTKEGGTGLGLAICYSIIEKHNGMISIDSEFHKGTIVTIYIPATRDKCVQEQDSGSIGQISGLHVLVMDDESVVQGVFGRMLNCLNCSSMIARNGHEAIELIEKQQDSGTPFDCVILDLTIPGSLGGRETLQLMGNKGFKIKSIVCSGYSDDRLLAQYRDHGFDSYLKKPFTLSELQEALVSLGLS